MATRAELVKRTLRRLGVLRRGEEPTYNDLQDVGAVMDSVHASLMDDGYVNWPLESCPLQCEDAFINYMAWKVADDFGVLRDSVIMRGEEGFRVLVAMVSEVVDNRDIPVVDY